MGKGFVWGKYINSLGDWRTDGAFISTVYDAVRTLILLVDINVRTRCALETLVKAVVADAVFGAFDALLWGIVRHIACTVRVGVVEAEFFFWGRVRVTERTIFL